jgi:hypothetical protein
MDETELIAELRRRGLARGLALALEVIEPLGALGAQMLWVAQPTAGLFGGREIAAELARVLEQPEGIARLRALLEEDV